MKYLLIKNTRNILWPYKIFIALNIHIFAIVIFIFKNSKTYSILYNFLNMIIVFQLINKSENRPFYVSEKSF